MSAGIMIQFWPALSSVIHDDPPTLTYSEFKNLMLIVRNAAIGKDRWHKHQRMERSLRATICFTKAYETIYKNGRSNIAIAKNNQTYFCRMFDSKLSPKELLIKRRYSWQGVKNWIRKSIAV
uniref:Uncharacterized protein n=1 Tax=Rhizophagus irregularis (strain DAOM 181602 / DAOM 197198 / MUCL 43194) TaxID=747089 RepID=U9U3H9_RHIID